MTVSECCAAALFDGHSGSYAADWLNTRLYELFSEAINDEIIGEGASEDACEVDGELCHAFARTCAGGHMHSTRPRHVHDELCLKQTQSCVCCSARQDDGSVLSCGPQGCALAELPARR